MLNTDDLHRLMATDLTDDVNRYVLADWLEESGRQDEADTARHTCRPKNLALVDGEVCDLTLEGAGRVARFFADSGFGIVQKGPTTVVASLNGNRVCAVFYTDPPLVGWHLTLVFDEVHYPGSFRDAVRLFDELSNEE